MFSKHHYLSHSHNNAAHVFVATLNGDICAFTSLLFFPHPGKKRFMKGHRTVVLPDFQGLGIGLILRNFAAQYYTDKGYSVIMTTSNPSMIASLKKSPLWITTRIGRTSLGGENSIFQNKNKKGSTSSRRITASFEYIGQKTQTQ